MLDAIARPFGMLLMFFYDVFKNYGVAILFFALVIKVILLPFQMKSKRGMIQQSRIQPKIAELQKKHGTNKAKLNEETMKLYKEEGVNPASGCIWGFLPLPIMLALFQVIRRPLTMMMGISSDAYALIVERLEGIPSAAAVLTEGYYAEIAQSQFIANSPDFTLFQQISESLRRVDFSFLGLDFSMTPKWDFLWNPDLETLGITWIVGFVLFLIPLISGGMQFLATGINRKMNPTAQLEGQAKSMNSMMMLMPLFSVYIGFVTPAALGFYWTVSTVLQIVQDIWLTKVYTKKIEAEEAVKNEERRRKEEEIEAKRQETERKRAEGVVERNPNTSKRKKQKSDKQGQIEKSAEWEKKRAPVDGEGKNEPSREGNRRYARGRAYDPDRYGEILDGDDYSGSESEHLVDAETDDNIEETDSLDSTVRIFTNRKNDDDSGDYFIDDIEDDEEYDDEEYDDYDFDDNDEEDEYDDEEYYDEEDDYDDDSDE